MAKDGPKLITSLGYSGIASDPTVVKLAEKYGVAPAQISLAWHTARGTAAIPKSKNPENQLGNLTVRSHI